MPLFDSDSERKQVLPSLLTTRNRLRWEICGSVVCTTTVYVEKPRPFKPLVLLSMFSSFVRICSVAKIPSEA